VSGGSDQETADSELVRRFQAGTDQAFGTLMERHERRVYNLAYRMMGNAEDARDATQDAFVSCFRHLSAFRGDSAFSTWLHRIAVNACYDALRKRRDTTSLEERPVEAAPVPDPSDQTVFHIDIQRALVAVPVDFRVVLVMHEIQDMPIDDIAAILEVPVGTVKSRLHRGRVALGRILSTSPPREPEGAPAPSKPSTHE
jgi:RNA polymerase sigma-70 factor (ECF subfamily)